MRPSAGLPVLATHALPPATSTFIGCTPTRTAPTTWGGGAGLRGAGRVTTVVVPATLVAGLWSAPPSAKRTAAAAPTAAASSTVAVASAGRRRRAGGVSPRVTAVAAARRRWVLRARDRGAPPTPAR